MVFRNMKKYKLFAEFNNIPVKNIELGLKQINKHGATRMTINDPVTGIAPMLHSPIPNSSNS